MDKKIEKRIETLTALGSNRDRLGLPFSDLDTVVNYLANEWKVEFHETPLGINDYVRSVVSEKAANSFETASAKSITSRFSDATTSILLEVMCDPELLGVVTSHRRHFLIDSIALAASVIRHAEISGDVLDIGCHVGMASHALARIVPNRVLGLDPVSTAISTARERVKDVANVEFLAGRMPLNIDRKFEFAMAIDSLPSNVIDRAHFLYGLSALLDSGGVALIVSANLSEADIGILRRQLKNCDLGYCFADVVGGYGGFPTGFLTEGCIVLVKGGKKQLPNPLQRAMENEWPSFREYANSPGVDKSMKTQAFKRSVSALKENQISHL